MNKASNNKNISLQMIAYISIYLITLFLIINMITRLEKSNDIMDGKENVNFDVSK